MRATLISAGAIAGAFAAIFGLMTLIGWDIPPYASLARAESIEQGLTAVIQGQQQLNRQMLQNDRRYWTDVRRQAMEDLQKDPNNGSAQRELDRAEEQIQYIDSQLGK